MIPKMKFRLLRQELSIGKGDTSLEFVIMIKSDDMSLIDIGSNGLWIWEIWNEWADKIGSSRLSIIGVDIL